MRATLLLIYFCILGLFSNAQANLTLSYGALQTTSIKKGEHLSITFRVGNTGNITAGKSHLKVYVSPNLTIASATLLSEISCESILAGQQSQSTSFIFPLQYNVSTGNNYVLISVDSRNEITETDENNTYHIASTFSVNTTIGGEQNLPYPVILMHGLNGSDQTWFPFIIQSQNYYGYSYGGNFDFCLNQDGDDTYSNVLTDVADWTDMTKVGVGDFYTVNFNVGNAGTKYLSSSKSNQSAIVKQGYAMSKIIKKVLAVTGRDKVILVGHSMGGLACRQYLQNSYLLQPDGRHHVAKLFTNGTPHGGSNSTSFVSITGLTPDLKSEAVRDLRRSYTYSGQGVYLFGGTETYASMNDMLFSNFYNIDVNCDGFDNSGNYITGLNYKFFPNNISYSCVIGEDPSTLLCGVTSEACDGVVNITSANLNNYLNVNADTFMCVRSGSGVSSPLHIELPQQSDYMFKGLDESNEYNTAYEIKSGVQYFGNISKQSATGYPVDYDDYKFSVPSSGKLNISLFNIPLSDYTITLLDSSTNLIGNVYSNGKGSLNVNTSFSNAGKYFLEFSGTPEQNSWVFPYAFKIDFTTAIPITGNIISTKGSTVKNAMVNLTRDSINSVDLFDNSF